MKITPELKFGWKIRRHFIFFIFLIFVLMEFRVNQREFNFDKQKYLPSDD